VEDGHDAEGPSTDQPRSCKVVIYR
jgi:hypothetical protein